MEIDSPNCISSYANSINNNTIKYNNNLDIVNKDIDNIKKDNIDNIKEKNFLKKDDISTSLLNSVIDEANKNLVYSQKELNYYIHEDSKRIIVKIVDSVTKETIKEIPDKKLLDIICKIQENIGILFNDTV